MGDKLNGLDLFSGIGGISLGLSDWVRTLAYCERDQYAQSVLLSRMSEGTIDKAPIWDDIRTLGATQFATPIDIIFGGFPCQDLSVSGKGEGISGERSGLFFDVVRLTRELNPKFVFLENVPAIRTRGLDQVLQEFTKAGYDCRWTMLSASSVGALHKRERWFLLAHSIKSSGWGGELLGQLTDKNGNPPKQNERVYNPVTKLHVQITLNRAVKLWPTPRASEYKDCGPVGSKSQIHMDKRDYLCAKVKDGAQPTGKLNPVWTEWLMGYPFGWTELNAWATQWFLSKRKKRLKS